MRAVIQRADGAQVTVEDQQVGGFTGPGLVVLLGVAADDEPADVEWIARKVAQLRVLREEQSVYDAAAPVLLISQFTLYADVRKGRRPSWNGAAPGPVAEPLVQAVATALREHGVEVSTGVFGAMMRVSLTNDGPFTIWLDSRQR